MKVFDLVGKATADLTKIGIESPNREARIMLAHAFQESWEYLILHYDRKVPLGVQNAFYAMMTRRLNFEPIAYILGSKEFYSQDFTVDNRVLIPRPETELLIDAVLQDIESSQECSILELGTGAGILAITLAKHLPRARIVATDISVESLACALINVEKHNVINQVQLIQSDWYEHVPMKKYDIIISNPPYVSQSERELVATETLKYEPHQALFASDNGLASYNAILANASSYLTNTGTIYFEIGFRQHQMFSQLSAKHGYLLAKSYEDINGIKRAVKFLRA